MRIVTATTSASTSEEAVKSLWQQINPGGRSDVSLDFVAVHGVASLVTTMLRETARTCFSGAALHGGTSCRGVMGGDCTRVLAAVGAFAIFDPCGDYGTASDELGADPQAAAVRVMQAALAQANRCGEAPSLVLLTVAPGAEEAVLRGIRSVIGHSTPIVGGSFADCDMTGNWAQFSTHGFHRSGLVISALIPSRPIGISFQGGFTPAGPNGWETSAQGRRVFEIDGRPAAQVYHEWTGGRIAVPDPALGSRTIMTETCLSPPGRVNAHLGQVPLHLLLQPIRIYANGALDLLADVAEGDHLWLMTGSADNLVVQAGNVARNAAAPLGHPHGGLVICCASFISELGARITEIADQMDHTFGGSPYLALFTHGEQGILPHGTSQHGNLMCSCAAFGSGPHQT